MARNGSSTQSRRERGQIGNGRGRTQRDTRHLAPSAPWWLKAGEHKVLVNNALIIAVAAGVILFAWLARIEHRDAINLAALFFVAGLLFAQLLRSRIFVGTADWPVLAVIALPAILYLVLAGYVTGLKIPGGLEVEIKELLKEAPKKLEASQLDRFANATSQGDCETVVNAVVLVEEDDEHTITHLQHLLNCNQTVHYVVFVKSTLEFIGMVEASVVRRTLESPISPSTNLPRLPVTSPIANLKISQLSGILSDGTGAYKDFFGPIAFRDEWSYTSATIGHLLTRMNEENLDAIALVDRMRRFEAVVEREELLSQLMLSIGGFADEDQLPSPTATPSPTRPPSPTPGPTATPSGSPAAASPTPRALPQAAPTRNA
jgi:hypothetical protein